MRTFEDATGRRWDVAVSAESYGTQRLIFAARADSELRARELDLSSRLEAEQLLLRLTDGELRALLETAFRWQPG